MTQKMTSELRRFLSSEDGNVTIDWIVLTAGLIAMALFVVSSISGGAEDLGTEMAAELSTLELG